MTPSPSTTSTASPASKSPATSVIPTGSRLVPPSRSARAAPASTTTWPCGRLGVLQPQLEARVARRAGRRSACPRARRARAAAIAPGASPLVITVSMPAAVAISAATTFERIPPEPSGEPAWPMSRLSSAAKSSTVSMSSRRGVAARVGRVQPVGVGEHHQPPGAQEHGDLGGEEVVVAERDLVGRRRVVLVDDRDDPPVEQLAQRLAGVEVVRARADVEEGEQHLGAAHASARAGARRRPDRACPGRRRWRPAARRSPAGAAGSSSSRIPRAIAPLVTITRSSPARVQVGDLAADRAAGRPRAPRRRRRRRCSSRA